LLSYYYREAAKSLYYHDSFSRTILKKLAEVLNKWVSVCVFRFLSFVRREIGDPILAQPTYISDIDPKSDSFR